MTKVTYLLMITLRVYPPSTYHPYLSLLIYHFCLPCTPLQLSHFSNADL